MSEERNSVIALLLSFVVFAGLGPVPCSAEEFTLRKHPVRLIEARQDDKRLV